MENNIQSQLNQFARAQWEKTLAFLQGHFSLKRDDCEDIFQESFIVLYQNALEGKLVNMTASLSTYFNGICRNKALELLRGQSKELYIIDEYPDTTKDEFEDDRIDKLLSLEDDSDQIEMRKEALVRQIVKDLPAPCDSILWGFYRDGFSMKTLASMLNYSSESSVKVTKHRCSEKFRNRFAAIANKLFT